MTSRDFCFWLQGYFELSEKMTGVITADQVGLIKRHLALVFTHEIDPSMGEPVHLEILNEIHNPVKIGGEVQTPLGPVKYRC